MAECSANILTAKRSMNGLKCGPTSAHLKQKASQGQEVDKGKPLSREGDAVYQTRPQQHLQPRAERVRIVFKDARTMLILKQVFCELCEKEVREVEREVMRLVDSNPQDGQLVRKVSRLIIEFIVETEQVSLNLKTFNQQEEAWNLHAGNVYTEFSKVAVETFKSAVNWGRIIMFLGFAASFTIYLEKDKMLSSGDSVLQWTCQILEEDLGEYISSHGGWEGFSDYLEAALRSTRRSHPRPPQSSDQGSENSSSMWSGALAAGAVAVGAMAALTLRQAFS